ncbi:CotH kinase family protein [Gorillibacterium sp. sgz5001074]|uniref:CotH kinase family protein n=1 Tax=Gorillibacterium sp. sgz5001074 TaxID=3446695 RepID=UPI003F66429F
MKIRAAAWVWGLVMALGLAGCSAGTASVPAAGKNGAVTVNPVGDVSGRLLDEKVFPKDKVVDVKITLDPAEFQSLLDTASEEAYKSASVNYNGQQLDNVAIRAKGNLTLRSVVSSNSDRFSFKLSFDEYVPGQELYGVEKINLNNGYSDVTFMREFLAYELAESMGLPTPKYSFVNVYVNDQRYGLYLAVEQIGDSYLERQFGNSKGALYKANGGTGSELNRLDSVAAYTGLDLKSGKTDEQAFLAFMDELNNGADYKKVLDVEEALKFIALNAVTVNMDSYLGQLKHNYYLYEQQGVFSILPWDYNMAFGGMGGGGSGTVYLDEPTQGVVADRPLVAKLLSVEAYKTAYHDIVRSMLTGYLSDARFQARIQQLDALIADSVEKDPTKFVTMDQYKTGLDSLKSFVSTQVQNLTKQLDGSSPSTNNGQGSGGGFGRGGGMPGMGGGQAGQRVRSGGNAQGQAGQGQQGLAQQGQQAAPNGQRTNRQGQKGMMPGGQQGQAQGQMPMGPGGQQGQGQAQGQLQGQMPMGPDGAGAPPDMMAFGNGGPNGQQPPDGGFQGGGGRMGGGGFPGGPGGGASPKGQGPLGSSGKTAGEPAVNEAGAMTQAAAAGVSVGALLIAAAVIRFYKRKTW